MSLVFDVVRVRVRVRVLVLVLVLVGFASNLGGDSLKRPLNIAEAAGKIGQKERSHFHAIARGSAMECGAILDVLQLLAVAPTQTTKGKELLVRIVAMLSKMCR